MRGKLVPHCERPQGHVKEFGLDAEGHQGASENSEVGGWCDQISILYSLAAVGRMVQRGKGWRQEKFVRRI